MELTEMRRGEQEVETEEIIRKQLGTEFSETKLFCLAHVLCVKICEIQFVGNIYHHVT
jgi:hypothetical protein